jgi:hypothetical protein
MSSVQEEHTIIIPTGPPTVVPTDSSTAHEQVKKDNDTNYQH